MFDCNFTYIRETSSVIIAWVETKCVFECVCVCVCVCVMWQARRIVFGIVHFEAHYIYGAFYCIKFPRV